jgi:hypothetical protein
MAHLREKFITLLFATTTAFTFNINLAKSAGENMTKPVVEIVTFKLAKGVTVDQFLAAASVTNTYLKSRKGFISRKLIEGKNGGYTDIAIWNSLEDAQGAMNASMTEQSISPFIMAIDPTTMKVDHQSVILSSD